MAAATSEKTLKYRGDVTALVGLESTLVLTTVHPEGQPTALYRIDLEKLELASTALPCGARGLIIDEITGDNTLYFIGTDDKLYSSPAAGGEATTFTEALEPAPTALALASEGRMAAIAGEELLIITIADGAVAQRLKLPQAGTALAADPSGNWLVVGTAKGTLVVFDCEEKPQFLAGNNAKAHNGEVTSLCFEPEELRVMSAGADGRLLVTHVRGTLEPEERGGRGGHSSGAIIAEGPAIEDDADKFYTGGRDGEVKIWTVGGGNKRPSTLKDTLKPVVAMAQVTYKSRGHVAIASNDNTIRLFIQDAAGKIEHRSLTIRDAYAWARRSFKAKEVSTRQEALQALAGYNDAKAIEMIASRASDDDDHALRVLAVELLGNSDNRRAVQPLEGLLRGGSEKVRRAALTGLRTLEGQSNLRPLELALGARKADIGVEAVQALGTLAGEDEQALSRLTRALDDNPREVRFAALETLEGFYGDDPVGTLIGLKSGQADLRWQALLRLHQRELLAEAVVRSALRRTLEDREASVRLMAFDVRLLSQLTLAQAVRHLDKDVHRRLYQIETHGEEIDPEAALPKTKKVKTADLTADDFAPLLEAMAGQALDTCVRGAVALAQLQDPRAFGTLLQLTRADDSTARVEACRALEALGDPRGLQRLRLMLRDTTGQVRDAAFTALSRLLSDTPLESAEAGLMAEHEDVRRRGLSVLVRQLKKKLPADPNDAAYGLLERALNDAGSAIRSEAFKATINLQVMGGGDATLAFALKSLHPNIRREVLTEVMGEIAHPWAWDMLLGLFDDPDQDLRTDAFAFAVKKGKSKGLAPLSRGLESPFADVRLTSVKALARKYSKETAPLLVKALDDDDADVRSVAINALKLADNDDALVKAMSSEHRDVRNKAAAARAVVGDEKALKPLLEQVNSERPEVSDLATLWQADTLVALEGLGALGHVDAVESLVKLLANDEASIRKGAAEALAWSDNAEDPTALKAALRHGDEAVRMIAAKGLARLADATGASILFAHRQAEDTPSRGGRRRATRRAAPTHAGAPAQVALWAALTLDVEDVFLSFLDHNDSDIRQQALNLMLLMEWRENDGIPDRCLAALSSADARVRIAGAKALEHFGDLDAFGRHVVDVFNDRGDGQKAWTITEETITQLAEAVTFGAPRLKARAAEVLKGLGEKKQGAFNRLWRVFSTRYAVDLDALAKAAKKRKAAKTAYDNATLQQLVFGAYTGLCRAGEAPAWVRRQALVRLQTMVAEGHGTAEAAIPVFVQRLTDNSAIVRRAAFEALNAVGYDVSQLSAEALATGQGDVGVMALELLAKKSGAKEGRRVLLDVLRTKEDGLEFEAVKLLEGQGEPVMPWAEGLQARSSRLRNQAPGKLAMLKVKPDAEAKVQKAALKALLDAVDSPFLDVRLEVAIQLGSIQEAKGFDPLVKLLATASNTQGRILNALARLADERTADAMLNRVDNDPAGNADMRNIYQHVGEFRRREVFPRLLADLGQKQRAGYAFNAALTVTGYNQYLNVDFDEIDRTGQEDDGWQKGQHARQHDLFGALLEAAWGANDTGWLQKLMAGAKWCPEAVVDGTLAQLAAFPKDNVRLSALDALSWRLRHREGKAEALVEALKHKDQVTQFVAAEGLALGGRADGISVLLASVDLLENISYRQRAVEALGKLGDPRALDLLLRLVNDEDNALQEQAAEAIGHLAEGEHREKIFKILKGLAGADDGVAEYALSGLRWFGGDAAWQFVRGRINDDDWSIRQRVCELLAHHDDVATREALAKQLIEDDDWDVAQAAATALRTQYGAESLEPDYIFIQSPFDDLEEDTLKRLCERGEAGRLLKVLPKINEDYTEEYVPPLVNALLTRDPAPVAEAVEALGASHDRTVEVAARILGRVGEGKKHGKAVTEAATQSLTLWSDRYQRLSAARSGQHQHRQALSQLTDRLSWLLWACGRLEAGAEVLIQVSAMVPREARPLRQMAITALSSGFAKAKGLDALVAAATGPDAELRTLASTAVSALDPKRAATLLEGALDDRPALDRLLSAADDKASGAILRGAAGQIHRQGVVLPHLVARGDIDGLTAALNDKTLKADARLGALEALARIAADEAKAKAAEKPILAVATNEKEDEDMRKAAWRALRRARRARAQKEVRS
ncbi:MAG: HEAT repeat domain-containing protein [Bradymonadia bacterium]